MKRPLSLKKRLNKHQLIKRHEKILRRIDENIVKPEPMFNLFNFMKEVYANRFKNVRL